MNIRILPAAQRDIDRAAEWYERQREGLGFEFLDCVGASIGKIELSPLAYRKVAGENRRCSLDRFPYALYFKVAGDVIVVGCLHAKRDPRLAKERGGGVTPFPEP